MMEFKTGWNRIYLLQALTLLCLVLGPTFVDSYVNFYPSRFHRFGGYSRSYGYHFPAYNAYHWSHSNSVAVPSYQQRNLTRTQSYYTTPSKSTTMAPRLPPPHATPENKCYECACTPEYNIYNMRKVAKQVEFPYAPEYLRKKTVYVTTFKKIDENVGGWNQCFGPLDERKAAKAGIAMSRCERTCYTRLDSNKNLYRGCFAGEYGVDPNKLGCHRQGSQGSVYCFCEGNLCNKESVNQIHSQ